MNGADVRTVTQQSLRDAIGVVPQAASLFNDTIRSNLLYGKRDATEEELIQAAKDAQILGFIESLDDGWETQVGDRGLKLSGGEKQRAAICRCLLKNPPFVLVCSENVCNDFLCDNESLIIVFFFTSYSSTRRLLLSVSILLGRDQFVFESAFLLHVLFSTLPFHRHYYGKLGPRSLGPPRH